MPNQQVTYVINLRDRASGKMKNLQTQTARTNKSFAGLGRTMTRFVGAAAIGSVLKNSVQKMADFEKTASNLSAITGATGEQLDFLKRKAIELGAATTKTSIDSLEAFKLIASAKPELLSNAQALAATTKEAIALSEASGLRLPDAAKSLTSALNQFGLSADQSSRVINVLAAGSKFAAAEIPDLATSLEEFGGIADSLNISLEQSAAAVETLSTKNLKGSRAGIQLKNVFLKLGASTNKNLNPQIVGLSKSLENLSKIQDDTTALTKMFGTENVLAAQTLIKQRKRVEELTEAMTGTNIAYEQQRINTDNLNSDVLRLGSAWEGLVLNLNKGSGAITQSFRNVVTNMTQLINWIDRLNTSAETLGQQVATELSDRFKAVNYDTPADQLKGINSELENQEFILKRLERKKVGVRSGLNYWTDKKEKEKGIAEAKEMIKNLEEYRKIIEAGGTLKPKPIIPPEFVEAGTIKLDKDAQAQIKTITGAAPKTFNINVENLIENFNIETTNLQESAVEVRKQITLAMAEALADVQPITD